VYNGLQRIAEYDGTTGDLNTRFVYATELDEPVVEINSGGTKTFFHRDRLGSVIARTSSGGTATNRYEYGPYGESDLLAGTSFGFTGQRFDSETGLYYFKARHYSPTLGRFLQPDPIGYLNGLHLQKYASNEPLNFTDPLGLKTVPGSTKMTYTRREIGLKQTIEAIGQFALTNNNEVTAVTATYGNDYMRSAFHEGTPSGSDVKEAMGDLPFPSNVQAIVHSHPDNELGSMHLASRSDVEAARQLNVPNYMVGENREVYMWQPGMKTGRDKNNDVYGIPVRVGHIEPNGDYKKYDKPIPVTGPFPDGPDIKGDAFDSSKNIA
jgi:RHS repeat-associated protein